QAWQNSIEIQSLRLGLEPEQIMAKDALMQLNQRAWQQAQTFPNGNLAMFFVEPVRQEELADHLIA
ncbi:hypothetical protein, partial [Acinetobacter baumannii]|uniref:hypothetical protein n=1 Tax=Acinetobacter baumannii TaxID=470 RepID=UPI001CB87D5F